MSQDTAQQTVDESSRDENAAKPNVHVCVRTSGLVAFILEVVDVTQDGLGDQEDYNRDAEDGMEGAELGEKSQSTSATV